MMVCVGVQGRKTRLLRVGSCLFAAMELVPAVGCRMFPLSDSGYAGMLQDKMHILSTILVVQLSIASLTVIIVAGARDRGCRLYSVCAGVALGMMLVGAPTGQKTQYFCFFHGVSIDNTHAVCYNYSNIRVILSAAAVGAESF